MRNFNRRRPLVALGVVLGALVFSASATQAAEPGDAPISLNHAAAVRPAAAAEAPASRLVAARVPLDLRVPELGSIMSRRQLLDELHNASDDEEFVEVVAAQALVPMSFDTQIPLGVVGSVQWSIDHPVQVWRILLPNPAS